MRAAAPVAASDPLFAITRCDARRKQPFLSRPRPGHRYRGDEKFQPLHRTMVPRGGGSINETSHSEANEEQAPLSSLPLIDARTVSLALRLTCETNRRLHRGGAPRPARRPAAAASLVPARCHPEHPHPPPLAGGTTVFHSTHPFEGAPAAAPSLGDPNDGNAAVDSPEARGGIDVGDRTQQARPGEVSRWGPDLDLFIDTLISSIGIDSASSHRQQDEAQLILALTLLYLDRSVSPDAPPLSLDPLTGQPWFPPCPYLVPRTVHRMVSR